MLKVDCQINLNNPLEVLGSPFIVATRHFAIAGVESDIVSTAERVKHVVIGIFEAIPIIGYLALLIDFLASIRSEIIVIDGSLSPYERGRTIGERCQKQIQFLFEQVEKKFDEKQVAFFTKALTNIFTYHSDVATIFQRSHEERLAGDVTDVAVSPSAQHLAARLLHLYDNYASFRESFPIDVEEENLGLHDFEQMCMALERSERNFGRFLDQVMALSDGVEAYISYMITEFAHAIDDDYHEELTGVAEGAGIDYQTAIKIHLYVDLFAGEYGCSAVASAFSASGEEVARLVTTNHTSLERRTGCAHEESLAREEKLLRARLNPSSGAHFSALGQVEKDDTILSVIMDISRGRLSVAGGGCRGHLSSNRKIIKKDGTSEAHTIVARTLDWPWKWLIPYRQVVHYTNRRDGKEELANVTFPGFIGSLTAMTPHLAMAYCSAGNSTSTGGMPITFATRHLLETSQSLQAVRNGIRSMGDLSSANLTFADREGRCMRFETGPELLEVTSVV